MTEERIKSLYARLQAQQPQHADQATAHRIGSAVRADAELLSAALAQSARADAVAQARHRRPLLGWAMAAAVALVAVFAASSLQRDAGAPTPYSNGEDSAMMAEGPAPLFSGSFEPGRGAPGAESIFDNDFGS